MKNLFLSISRKDWFTALFIWWFLCFCVLFLTALGDGDFGLFEGARFALFSPILTTFSYPSDLLEGRYYMWPFLFLHPLLDLPLFALLSSKLRKKHSNN